MSRLPAPAAVAIEIDAGDGARWWSVAEYGERLAGLLSTPAPVRVPLRAALGRALAEDVTAGQSVPLFDNSAMDGYAVRAVDTRGASENRPLPLRVLGDLPAGALARRTVGAGTAFRIMTGAPIPPGADAVVEVEATDAGADVVRLLRAAPPGRHIRRAGEDIARGARAATAGTALGPRQLGLLAALGEQAVTVVPALRVLLVSTGSELAAPGLEAGPAQVPDVNTTMLGSAIEQAGARVVAARRVDDEPSRLRELIATHLESVDLVLTSGGVSAGAFEVVKQALGGDRMLFTRVAMHPGRPQGSGRLDGTPIVALPGNPTSALVSFEVLVRPALRSAMGFRCTRRATQQAISATAIRTRAGMRSFQPAVLDTAAGVVRPLGAGTHSLRALALADCLIDIPEHMTSVPAGSTVDVWRLDG